MNDLISWILRQFLDALVDIAIIHLLATRWLVATFGWDIVFAAMVALLGPMLGLLVIVSILGWLQRRGDPYPKV